jgi:hypothetical protein
MTLNGLDALEDRLAQASAADLPAVVLDGLAMAWPQTDTPLRFDPDLALSMDKARHLIVQTLPDWTISLQGSDHVSGGHWSCTLRESGLRDDLEVLGIGTAKTAPLAMLVALLHVLIRRSKGYT